MNTTKHLRGRGHWPRAAAPLAALPLLLAGLAMAAPATPPKHITNTANLTFGRFVPAAGGTVIVSPAGARSRTGAVVLLSSSVGPARFSIGANNPGNENRAYILTLPANGAVAMTSGANRMPLVNFVSSGPADGTLPSGAQTVTVGATLQVAPNQSRGNYTGTFPVILEYQ